MIFRRHRLTNFETYSLGETVAATKLAPQLDTETLKKVLRDISRRALENSEGKGLSTLFMTFGIATWPSQDQGRSADVPGLMLPVTISKKEVTLTTSPQPGSFQLNLVLLHILEDRFKLKLHAEDLLSEFASDEEAGTVLDVEGFCGKTQGLAWLASALDSVRQTDPEIGGFVGATHGRCVDEFIRLDEERIALAVDRVRRAHGEHAIAAMNANPAGEQLIRAEAGRVRKHLPLRKVFSQAADILTAVCPCWMASPLSVRQLPDSGKQYFDFVIFDEASQVLPEDAIPSVLRGHKLVVAGDSEQLPPSTFFAAADDELAGDEEASGTEGFESLLDTMNSFLDSSYLDWHYRSRDETLINRYIYQTPADIPGTWRFAGCLSCACQSGTRRRWSGRLLFTGSAVCVSLIIEYAKKTPETTLGVITMGIRHMTRVQAALDRAVEQHSELADSYNANKSHGSLLRICNAFREMSEAQSSSASGYGKDRAGNLPWRRFGPLVPKEGRKRLNVGVTREREKVIVVSSFSPPGH